MRPGLRGRSYQQEEREEEETCDLGSYQLERREEIME